MPIDKTEVERIAELAQLELTPEEGDRLALQFEEILEYFAQLERIQTDHVEPMYHGLLGIGQTPMRDDVVRPGLSPSQALENSPDQKNDQFRVPSVIE